MSKSQFSISVSNCFTFLNSVKCKLDRDERAKFLNISIKSGKIGTVDKMTIDINNSNCANMSEIFKKYDVLAEQDEKDWIEIDKRSKEF